MFDQLVDGVRKASESSLNMQQEMFRQWSRAWMAGAPGGLEGVGDWNRAAQRRWVDLGIETLNKHRESLDAAYKSNIQFLEQTLKSAGRI
jgi:hypothetical protein